MIDANRHPANRAALVGLNKLNLAADPEQLYLHQLMLHYLAANPQKTYQARDRAARMRETLELLDARKPELLLKWLEIEEDEVFTDDPDALACEMLQLLHVQMAARIENYP